MIVEGSSWGIVGGFDVEFGFLFYIFGVFFLGRLFGIEVVRYFRGLGERRRRGVGIGFRLYFSVFVFCFFVFEFGCFLGFLVKFFR